MRRFTQNIGNIFDRNTGTFKLIVTAVFVTALVFGAGKLASLAFSKEIPDFNTREKARIAKVEVAYQDFLDVARIHYCLGRVRDLKEKIEIKEALGEDVAALQLQAQTLTTKEGCEKAIEEVLFQ